MTGPSVVNTILPPADTLNRSAKELWGFYRSSIPRGTAGPVTSVQARTLPAPGALTLHSFSGLPLELTAQPAGATNYFRNWMWYPAKAFTHCRICVHVFRVGAATSRAYVQYNATPENPATWVNAGRLAQFIAVGTDVLGSRKGGWVSLDPAARADVAWRAMSDGGDGVLSPAVGDVEIEFDVQPEIIRERWYWRDLAPLVIPTPVPENLWVYPSTFWGCTGWPRSDWVTPTPEQARVAARSFARGKGSIIAATGFSTTRAGDDQKVYSGPGFVIVGAPLAAQDIPPFDYQTAWAGTGGGGSNTCHLTTQLHLYRPGVGMVYSSVITGLGNQWFRYIPRSWTHGIPMGAMAAQANDRFVLWGSLSMELVCSAFAENGGLSPSVGYNGDADIPGPSQDASGYWQNAASYTDFPRLRYLNEVA